MYYQVVKCSFRHNLRSEKNKQKVRLIIDFKGCSEFQTKFHRRNKTCDNEFLPKQLRLDKKSISKADKRSASLLTMWLRFLNQ